MKSRHSHNGMMPGPSEINLRCTRCGACLDECPNQAIVAGLISFAIDIDFCDGHGNCIAVCPEGAITKKPLPSKEVQGK